MIKQVKMFSLSLTVAMLVAGASQANAQSVPAYYTTFYSDATYQTAVGYLYPECKVLPYVYVQYHLTGSYTRYSLDEYAFSCGEYGPEMFSLFQGMDKPWKPYGSSADTMAAVKEPGMALRPTVRNILLSKPPAPNRN
jgi:hypothetical protein